MKITLDEVEAVIAMHRKDLATMDLQQEDIDYIEKRLQYWNEAKKKLLEDQFLQIQGCAKCMTLYFLSVFLKGEQNEGFCLHALYY